MAVSDYILNEIIDNPQAKEAVLKTPTTTKFIRLVGVETYGVGNQTNKFMSAAEVLSLIHI